MDPQLGEPSDRMLGEPAEAGDITSPLKKLSKNPSRQSLVGEKTNCMCFCVVSVNFLNYLRQSGSSKKHTISKY